MLFPSCLCLFLVDVANKKVLLILQVQQESMYLVKTTSNLLNNTLHPEMAR